jgi:hypothetical protein
VVFLLVYALVMPSLLWIVMAFLWVAGFSMVLAWRYLWLEKPYIFYNRLVRRLVIPLVRYWVLAVTFGVALMANRPFAGRLQAAGGNEETAWHPRTMEEGLGVGSASGVALDESSDALSLHPLLRWTRQRGNGWMLALVPFVLMLRLLDAGEEKSAMSSDTYTLY